MGGKALQKDERKHAGVSLLEFLANIEYFTNLDLLEIRRFPLPQLQCGVRSSRDNLTSRIVKYQIGSLHDEW